MKVLEEADKSSRVNNIIIYNAVESEANTYLERQREERDFCVNLMKDVLKVGFEEGDIKKLFRLGKRREDGKERPLLIQFSDGRVKNLVMENAGKLSQAKGKFEKVTISHDMTVKEREQCRLLVSEAKQKQADDVSGEWLYKVRGPPGQMKIIRIKNYH